MNQQSNYESGYTQEPEEYYLNNNENISYAEAKQLLTNNAFSVNEMKVPEVPPRNIASRKRAQSMYVDNSKYSFASSSSLQQYTPVMLPQTTNSNNSQYAPVPPQRQINIAVPNQTGIPQPPVHNYGVPNSNNVMLNNSVIYQNNDYQKQMLVSQSQPQRSVPQAYQMNRQLQHQASRENLVNGNYSVSYNQQALPVQNQYDIQYTQAILNPDLLSSSNPSDNAQNKTLGERKRRESLSSYSMASSIATPGGDNGGVILQLPPNSQNSNYQNGRSLPSPISPAQSQNLQNRPPPNYPDYQSSTVSSSYSSNYSTNYTPQMNPSTNSVPTSTPNNVPLTAPTRITSMMLKPGQQLVYRTQAMNNVTNTPMYKSVSTPQISSQLSQGYYQSPMVQPTPTSTYLTNQYYPNGKISPAMKPQRSPQLVISRKSSIEDGIISGGFEGPSIPPRKIKPRYSTSSYYSSPSLSGMSYSPRLLGLKNDDYENYRNNRPKSMISTSSEKIIDFPKRMSTSKTQPATGFAYRNNSRNSIGSSPDLFGNYFNSNNIDVILPEGTEVNNYVNSNASAKYNKYARSVHGFSTDEYTSERREPVGNLRKQYGSSNSLSNLVKYDQMKIENMFMDDDVYQIGDMRDKFPLIDHSPLLSEIASDFNETISLVRHIKDGIEYLDCFSGYEAVSLLAEILGTYDRKVALQTGQVLEAYGMFHDVVYMHKLMDNRDIFYQMHTLAVPLATRVATFGRTRHMVNEYYMDLRIKNRASIYIPEEVKKKEEEEKIPYPTGVLVGIAQCYSPTCFEDSPCYSYSCPKRRMYELVKRKKVNIEQIKTAINATLPHQDTWSTSIGKPYLKKLEKKEIKRQEIIFELIQTEKEYIDDLLVVKNKIMQPLAEGRVSKIGEEFVQNVFSNIEELYEVNSNFYNNIRELQKRKPLLESIGDVVKDFIPHLHCYEKYGSSQPSAKHILQVERNTNKQLNNFFKDAQSQPEFRRLPIESFLARPTTRLGRYPILIKDIIKNTPEGHRDIILLTDALQQVENVLKEVNYQAGRATNKLKLEEWAVLLESERKDDISMLRLENPEREFIREGKLEMKRYANESQNHSFIPVTLVLLDNMLVITRPKVNSIEIYKKPIPLQLLNIIVDENSENGVEVPVKHKRGNKIENRKYYTFSLEHQGVATYVFQTSIYSDQKSWVDCITEQLSKYRKESVVEVIPLVTNSGTKVIAANYYNNVLFLLATDSGVYMQNENKMKLVLPLTKITHMEIMMQYKLLFIISNKEVFPYSIDLLINGIYITKPSFRKVKKLCSNVTFIAVGRCDERDLLCCVKTTSLNSTIKIFEPLSDGLTTLQHHKPINDAIVLYKQFYIPSEARSITFLKKSMCIGCVKGFEVVDVNTLTTQSLIANVPKFDFILKSDNIPLRMYRTPRQDFLLLYSKVGFYLDKNGNRSRPNIMFRWFSVPSAFSYYPPFIFSFESNTINVWEENNPEVVKQVIPCQSVKLLYENHNQVIITEMKNQKQLISLLQVSRYISNNNNNYNNVVNLL